MNRHYVDLGSASDWLKFASTNQKYYPDLVNARHHYAISALVSQTLFRGKTSGDMAKFRLFFSGYDFVHVVFMNYFFMEK